MSCSTSLVKCVNNGEHDVCNRYLLSGGTPALCDYCGLTETIPDLTVAGNDRRWYELETAKRRLLYTLEALRLPIRGTTPPLVFDFKGDQLVEGWFWRALGKKNRVYTGHANGRITINITEADSEKREKLRIDLNESHRTLVGHFHHEIGHFYWEVFVKGEWLQRFIALFGNHENPTYSEALDTYYKNGARPDWQASCVSAYATMHPWEDFAETFAAYLDMVATVDTAQNFLSRADTYDVATAEFPSMLARYTRLGIALNELNRTLGLIDFLPDVFSAPVRGKLEFIHDLLRAHQCDAPS